MASSFDPFTQNLTFHLSDESPLNVTVGQLDDFVQYGIKICIVYGSQLGASMALFILLVLLTKPDKRLSPVFLLNSSALVFNICRLVCNCVYFTTEFSKVYPYFSGDYSRVPTSAFANSILAVVFEVLLLISIECSLVLQSQAICATLLEVQKRILLGISVFIALVAIGFRLGLAVENSISIMEVADFGDFIWLQSATNIVVIISICFFSAIFVLKLGHAIQQRKKLGIKRFGAMQVIFIMGCQTMIIPAVFAILQYCVNVPEMDSFVLTLVAISLPLSSMWAAFLLHSGSEPTSESSERRKLWKPISYWGSEKSRQSSAANSSLSSATNMTCRVHSSPTAAQLDRLYPDLEAGTGIGIKHDISMSSIHR